MIIELHKYLIFGTHEEMDKFFALAQRAGFLEFIGPTRKKALELPPEAKTFLAAIKIAKHYPVHPAELPRDQSEPEVIAEKIVATKAELETLFETERVLMAEVARIAVFGDFSRSELNAFEVEAKRSVQFFCMKSSLASATELPPEIIYVGTDYDLDYFVSVNREPTQYPKMIEIQIEHPVGELRNKLHAVREEIAKLELDLRTLANAMPYLQEGLIEHLNTYHLKMAKHSATLSFNNQLFAIEAWVPATRIESLHGLLSTLSVEAEQIAIESKDSIPTCIENRGAGKVGEDLLHIFDTPAYNDKDPSLWLLVFFSLFFAMIISDAGYGLLFLGNILLLKWKLPHLQGVKKRLLKLGMALSCASIFWGVITASYFGLDLKPDNPLQKVSVMAYLVEKKADYHIAQKDDVYEELVLRFPATASLTTGQELIDYTEKDIFPIFEEFWNNILMEFSFLIGIIHITLSFCRYLRRNWAGLGWIFFMAGGYLYFPSIVHATTIVNFTNLISKPTAYAIGIYFLFAGLGIAFLAALIKKKIGGAIQEVLHVVQVFADVLSYLRLYALALAGIVVARTFNDTLGIQMNFIMGSILIFLGHSLNISLCLMGAIIHGLRLNFLEWFHYSFIGGGRLFNPLALKRFEK